MKQIIIKKEKKKNKNNNKKTEEKNEKQNADKKEDEKEEKLNNIITDNEESNQKEESDKEEEKEINENSEKMIINKEKENINSKEESFLNISTNAQTQLNNSNENSPLSNSKDQNNNLILINGLSFNKQNTEAEKMMNEMFQKMKKDFSKIIQKDLEENNKKLIKLEEDLQEAKGTINKLEKNVLEKDNIIDNMKEDISKLSKLSVRVSVLEEHAVLFYNQIALYQNSRDDGKSIFYYLYKYFGLTDDDNLFHKTKRVLKYLNEDTDTDKITMYQKLVLKKFLKIMFFLNFYHNKILHAEILSSTKEVLNNIQKKDNKHFPIFPEFNYSQFINSFKFFIHNTIKNEEIQAVLNDAYNDYCSKYPTFGAICDKNEQTIYKNGNTIKFKIEEKEIDDAIDFLNNIKIGDNLEFKCDTSP